MNDLVGKYYDASQFIDYKADVEQQLLIIYLSGYLTIKDFNERLYTFKIYFPNEEVRNGFIDAIASGFFQRETIPPTAWIINVATSSEKGTIDGFKT